MAADRHRARIPWLARSPEVAGRWAPDAAAGGAPEDTWVGKTRMEQCCAPGEVANSVHTVAVRYSAQPLSALVHRHARRPGLGQLRVVAWNRARRDDSIRQAFRLVIRRVVVWNYEGVRAAELSVCQTPTLLIYSSGAPARRLAQRSPATRRATQAGALLKQKTAPHEAWTAQSPSLVVLVGPRNARSGASRRANLPSWLAAFQTFSALWPTLTWTPWWAVVQGE